MDIYNFDPVTGEFTAAGKADPDPLQKGKWLVPANATSIQPPVAAANEVAVMVEGNWALMEDFRGAEYWLADGSHHLITRIGEKAPVDALATEPPGLLRQKKQQEIDTAAGRTRARFISDGALIDAEYIQAESAARTYVDAGYAGPVPASVQAWVDAAGLTAQQAADDILATAQQWRALLDQIRAIRLSGKAAVDAAADADIETTAQSYIEQLDAMKPA